MPTQILTKHNKLIALIAGAILYALIPLFVQSPYYIDLFIILLVNAVLGMTFIMTLRVGLVNLAIAPFWGIGAYLSTVLTMYFHLSFWLSLPLCALLTALFAWIIGYILMKSGGTGFGFIMLTAVIGMLFVVTVGNIRFLGAYNGVMNIPAPEAIKIPFLPAVEFTSRISFFYLALTLFVIIILISSALYSSWAGRAWTATGLSPNLAGSLGINTFRYKLLSFIISCGILGLIGSFYAHYMAFIVPTTFGMWINIYIQIYAILGGLGYVIFGPIIGSAIMTFFPEALRTFREYAPIFTGCILVLLILFLPTGILSLVDSQSWIGRHMIELSARIKTSLSRNRKAGNI